MRFGQRIRGKQFTADKARQILLFLLFVAEINNRKRTDAGMTAVAYGKRSVAGHLFRDEHRGTFIEAEPAVLFRDFDSTQAEIGRLFRSNSTVT